MHLDRHKCKLKPDAPEKAIEFKKVDIEDRSEDFKVNDIGIERGPKKGMASNESDIIAESHSETVRFISKFFKPGTIKLTKEKDKKVIKDLLKSPIESYKFLDKRELNFIKVVLRISTIGELLQYTNKNLYDSISATHLKSLEEKGIDISELLHSVQKAITISSILNQLKMKSIKLDQEAQKIIVAGLDKAGKTAILTTYSGQLGIENLSKLKPTIEVDRKIIETREFKFFIWDFGGQTRYRQKYLQNPSAYFLNLSLLLYVIDVQDYERFDESFDYFKKILNVLIMLEENPNLLVFIHKYDPDLREDPDIQLNVEFVKENLREILSEVKMFDYEVYLTSIYSVISREPKFSKFIKEMVNERDLVVDPTLAKIEELGKIIENALKAIITLSESVSQQFREVDARFNWLEGQLKDYALFSENIDNISNLEAGTQQNLSPVAPKPPQYRTSLPPPPLLHPPPPTTVPPPVESSSLHNKGDFQKNVRSAIISELNQLFTQVKKQEY
jgi:signal recognition particle receptor subunit beta